MKPSLRANETGNVEPVKPIHLALPSSRQRPLCGETASDAVIGAYVEHLDSSGDEFRWVREVVDRGRKPAKACEHCLSLYPSVLL